MVDPTIEGCMDIDDLESECNQLRVAMKRLQKKHAAKIKEREKSLHKKIKECLSTNGGRGPDGRICHQGVVCEKLVRPGNPLAR